MCGGPFQKRGKKKNIEDWEEDRREDEYAV